MGLTFQQSFYRVPEEVFLISSPLGTPLAIIEKPEDPQKANELKTILGLSDLNIIIRTLNFDEFILAGYRFLDSGKINRKEYGIY